MAYLGSFDANTVEPADFSALPAGDYSVLISSSEWKPAKSGGQYLSLTLQVLEGPHQGRFLWHNLNLSHPTAQAAEIAQRELSAICRAVGRMTIEDSEQLHDIPMIVKVAYIPPKDQWPEKNQIKQWRPMNGVTAAPASTPAPAAKAPPRPATPPSAAPSVPKAPPAPPKAPAAVAGKPWGRPASAPAQVAEVADDDIDF